MAWRKPSRTVTLSGMKIRPAYHIIKDLSLLAIYPKSWTNVLQVSQLMTAVLILKAINSNECQMHGSVINLLLTVTSKEQPVSTQHAHFCTAAPWSDGSKGTWQRLSVLCLILKPLPVLICSYIFIVVAWFLKQRKSGVILKVGLPALYLRASIWSRMNINLNIFSKKNV